MPTRKRRGPDALLDMPPQPFRRSAIRYGAMKWLSRDVTTVGFGRRQVDGKFTDELAIQFTVRRKLPKLKLKAVGVAALPQTISILGHPPIRTDVVQGVFGTTGGGSNTGSDPLGVTRRSRLDPVRPGSSIGHFASAAGTLGCIVRDDRGAQYALSAWHVLGGPHIDLAQEIAQPGPLDDVEESKNRIGILVRRYLGLAGDAAICSIDGRTVDSKVLGFDVAPSRAATPQLGESVAKSGRTTGMTFGIVTRVEVVAVVSYPQGDRNIGGFEISADPSKPAGPGGITEKGDSGSLWVRTTDPGVGLGLQVCGAIDPTSHGELAIACLLGSVMDKLQIKF